MQPKASMDACGINMQMIKYIKWQIAKPLSHLFSLSVTTGVFPSKLKTSRTIPIFKAGDRASCDNYRPISLLSSISKILEKIIANQLMNHLDTNNLLYVNQFGFLRNCSTIHSLTKLTNKIASDLNEKKYVIGVFLDLKKAFDCVSHDILLEKLKNLVFMTLSLTGSLVIYLTGFNLLKFLVLNHLIKPLTYLFYRGAFSGKFYFSAL